MSRWQFLNWAISPIILLAITSNSIGASWFTLLLLFYAFMYRPMLNYYRYKTLHPTENVSVNGFFNPFFKGNSFVLLMSK